MQELICFPPIFDNNSKVLLLGTFPSPKSREAGMYFSHPQNRFWKVLAKVFEQDVPISKEQKIKFLLKNNIALYDVIESCDIIGSSDLSIKNVEPAFDVINKIKKESQLQVVALNGSKAKALFDKYFHFDDIEVIYLPSTSPANAKMNLEKLVEKWKILVKF